MVVKEEKKQGRPVSKKVVVDSAFEFQVDKNMVMQNKKLQKAIDTMNSSFSTKRKQEELKKFCSMTDWSINSQYVHTDIDLCIQQVNKCEQYVSFVGKKIVVFNIEYAEVLVRRGIRQEDILFVTDCIEKAEFVKCCDRYKAIKVLLANFGKEWIPYIMQKNRHQFDCLLANYPFEDPSGSGNLWEHFVLLSLELVKSDGFICALHPGSWRKPIFNNPRKKNQNSRGPYIRLWPIMKEKQFLHIEINGYDSGNVVFDKGTRYDWYVMKNCPVYTETVVRFQDSKEDDMVDLKEMELLPNSMPNEVFNLLAKKGEARVDVVYYPSQYHHQHEDRVREIKDENDGFTVQNAIHSVNVKNQPTLWWSKAERSFPKISKVVWGSGNGGYFIDDTGDFVMTEYCAAIADEKENLKDIAKALRSEKFKEISRAISTGTNELDKAFLSYLHKDFWKDFI